MERTEISGFVWTTDNQENPVYIRLDSIDAIVTQDRDMGYVTVHASGVEIHMHKVVCEQDIIKRMRLPIPVGGFA